MPITFEEVTGEIQRKPDAATAPELPSPGARAEDLRQQLERELQLMAERAARICAD